MASSCLGPEAAAREAEMRDELELEERTYNATDILDPVKLVVLQSVRWGLKVGMKVKGEGRGSGESWAKLLEQGEVIVGVSYCDEGVRVSSLVGPNTVAEVHELLDKVADVACPPLVLTVGRRRGRADASPARAAAFAADAVPAVAPRAREVSPGVICPIRPGSAARIRPRPSPPSSHASATGAAFASSTCVPGLGGRAKARAERKAVAVDPASPETRRSKRPRTAKMAPEWEGRGRSVSPPPRRRKSDRQTRPSEKVLASCHGTSASATALRPGPVTRRRSKIRRRTKPSNSFANPVCLSDDSDHTEEDSDASARKKARMSPSPDPVVPPVTLGAADAATSDLSIVDVPQIDVHRMVEVRCFPTMRGVAGMLLRVRRPAFFFKKGRQRREMAAADPTRAVTYEVGLGWGTAFVPGTVSSDHLFEMKKSTEYPVVKLPHAKAKRPIAVHFSDAVRLNGNMFLNDTIVEAYLSRLKWDKLPRDLAARCDAAPGSAPGTAAKAAAAADLEAAAGITTEESPSETSAIAPSLKAPSPGPASTPASSADARLERFRDKIASVVHIFSPFFHGVLQQALDSLGTGRGAQSVAPGTELFEREAEVLRRLRGWHRDVNLLEQQLLLIPVCEALHWSLVAVFHPGRAADARRIRKVLTSLPVSQETTAAAPEAAERRFKQDAEDVDDVIVVEGGTKGVSPDGGSLRSLAEVPRRSQDRRLTNDHRGCPSPPVRPLGPLHDSCPPALRAEAKGSLLAARPARKSVYRSSTWSRESDKDFVMAQLEAKHVQKKESRRKREREAWQATAPAYKERPARPPEPPALAVPTPSQRREIDRRNALGAGATSDTIRSFGGAPRSQGSARGPSSAFRSPQRTFGKAILSTLLGGQNDSLHRLPPAASDSHRTRSCGRGFRPRDNGDNESAQARIAAATAAEKRRTKEAMKPRWGLQGEKSPEASGSQKSPWTVQYSSSAGNVSRTVSQGSGTSEKRREKGSRQPGNVIDLVDENTEDAIADGPFAPHTFQRGEKHGGGGSLPGNLDVRAIHVDSDDEDASGTEGTSTPGDYRPAGNVRPVALKAREEKGADEKEIDALCTPAPGIVVLDSLDGLSVKPVAALLRRYLNMLYRHDAPNGPFYTACVDTDEEEAAQGSQGKGPGGRKAPGAKKKRASWPLTQENTPAYKANVPTQDNDKDCGLFTLAFAERLLELGLPSAGDAATDYSYNRVTYGVHKAKLMDLHLFSQWGDKQRAIGRVQHTMKRTLYDLHEQQALATEEPHGGEESTSASQSDAKDLESPASLRATLTARIVWGDGESHEDTDLARRGHEDPYAPGDAAVGVLYEASADLGVEIIASPARSLRINGASGSPSRCDERIPYSRRDSTEDPATEDDEAFASPLQSEEDDDD